MTVTFRPRNVLVGIPPPGMTIYCLLCGGALLKPLGAHGIAGYDSVTGKPANMAIHHGCTSALDARLRGDPWWDGETLMVAQWPDSRETVPSGRYAPTEQRDQGDEVGT